MEPSGSALSHCTASKEAVEVSGLPFDTQLVSGGTGTPRANIPVDTALRAHAQEESY